MKSQKIIGIVLIVIASTFFSTAQANFRFYIQYAITQNTYTGGEGLFDELMELHDRSQSSADLIAQLWYKRALTSCEREAELAAKAVTDKYFDENPNFKYSDLTEEQKNANTKEIFEKIRPCMCGYYYDNWDKINKMIAGKLNMLKKEK